MQHEKSIENELAGLSHVIKETLAAVNIMILTEEVSEKKLNNEVFNQISQLEMIQSIMTTNSFRNVNKECKYLFTYRFYDLDKLSSYLIFSIFKPDEDNILPKNGFDMLLSGLCVFSKRMELYLATFDGCEKYSYNIIDEKFTFKNYLKM